jgi:glycosyltransferase involved in cell wall biosynthesis
MHIILVDDFPYDGTRATAGPIGAMEKAVGQLAVALTERDHTVQVFTQCTDPQPVGAVAWRAMGSERPEHADALIACRRPSLLNFVAATPRRILWATAPGFTLQNDTHRPRIFAFNATTVLHGNYHQQTWDAGLQMPMRVITPGIAAPFLERKPMESEGPPVAIVTGDPRHGLDWLVQAWLNGVHPIAPKAELHIYSAALDAFANGGTPPPEDYRKIHYAVAAAKHRNVKVKPPLPDAEMAVAMRAARVHLHAGSPLDMLAGTLAESQAIGLPAVIRPSGAAVERVRNGQSGVITDDEGAFTTAVLKLLNNDSEFRRMSAQARMTAGRRNWDAAAADWEALFAELAPVDAPIAQDDAGDPGAAEETPPAQANG